MIGSSLGVFFISDLIELNLFLAGLGLLKQLLEERDAPTTPRSGPATLRKLTDHSRLLNPNEIDQLSTRHVKAVTDFLRVSLAHFFSVKIPSMSSINRHCTTILMRTDRGIPLT